MADPTARFVISGQDATMAAFASANRHLQQFKQTAMSMRNVLASFGVALSGRAFAQWMSRAIETTDAVGEQRKAVEEAQKAFESFKKASDELAESFAVRSTPAVVALAEAISNFKRSIDPSDLDIYNSRVANTRSEIEQLTAELDKRLVNEDKTFLWLFSANGPFNEQAVASLRQRLAQLRMDLAALEAGAPSAGSMGALALFDLDAIRAKKQRMLALPKFDPVIGPTAAQLQRAQQITEQMKTDVEQQVDAWQEVQALFGAGALSGETLARFQDSLLEPIEVTAKRIGTTFKDMKEQGAKAAEALGMSFQNAFSDWLVGTDRDFKDLLKRMAADMATSALFEGLASLFAGKTGGIAGFLASFFGGIKGRADGGPVSAGSAYVVGERGPELFFPGRSGQIAPAAAAAVTVVNNIDARGADSSVLARLPALLESERKRTKAEIQDLMRRGRFY